MPCGLSTGGYAKKMSASRRARSATMLMLVVMHLVATLMGSDPGQGLRRRSKIRASLPVLVEDATQSPAVKRSVFHPE